MHRGETACYGSKGRILHARLDSGGIAEVEVCFRAHEASSNPVYGALEMDIGSVIWWGFVMTHPTEWDSVCTV